MEAPVRHAACDLCLSLAVDTRKCERLGNVVDAPAERICRDLDLHPSRVAALDEDARDAVLQSAARLQILAGELLPDTIYALDEWHGVDRLTAHARGEAPSA